MYNKANFIQEKKMNNSENTWQPINLPYPSLSSGPQALSPVLPALLDVISGWITKTGNDTVDSWFAESAS